jgi:hypothetical protein
MDCLSEFIRDSQDSLPVNISLEGKDESRCIIERVNELIRSMFLEKMMWRRRIISFFGELHVKPDIQLNLRVIRIRMDKLCAV